MAEAIEVSSLQRFAAELVGSTREYIYIRPEDGLIILRPNRLHHLNPTATLMLDLLYNDPDGPNVEAVVAQVASRYGAEPDRVREDLRNLLTSVAALLNDNICAAPAIRQTPYGTHHRDLPVLSEIALTYDCQNRCTFCYADAPHRGRLVQQMTTEQVRVIIDRIYDEAHCPTVSFTGGEPTLRRDLPELVAYAKGKGMRVNLITNGIRCADVDFVAFSGWGRARFGPGEHRGGLGRWCTMPSRSIPAPGISSVQAVQNLRAAGIHTHTNTTICGANRDHLLELVDYHRRWPAFRVFLDEHGHPHGDGPGARRGPYPLYGDRGDHSRRAAARAKPKGCAFVWYSPLPYCMFNPVQAGLGSKSCACVDGLISVNPAGQLIPCSSFDQGIGDLLQRPFRAGVVYADGALLAAQGVYAAGLPALHHPRCMLRRLPALLG